MLRRAQHERIYLNDCTLGPFALSSVEGLRFFPQPIVSLLLNVL